jgi:hypothetical protein
MKILQGFEGSKKQPSEGPKDNLTALVKEYAHVFDYEQAVTYYMCQVI